MVFCRRMSRRRSVEPPEGRAMPDPLDELQRAVRELGEELRRLESRVARLEGVRRSDAQRRDRAPGGVAAASPATVLRQKTIVLAGRALLVLAGAYVARALTDAHVVPTGLGILLGLGYAVFWLLRADRLAGRGEREGAAFYAVTGSLVVFPLIWEATARFGLVGPSAASAALGGFFGLGLVVARRRGLGIGAYATTGLALATAVALLIARRDLAASFAALLVVGAGVEWLAYCEQWLPLRWWAAAVLDGVAVLLAAIVTRPQGLPEGYVPVSSATAAGTLLVLPALYLAGLVARTIRLGRPVTSFEATQSTVAILLGFGGAWKVLSGSGGSVVGLGVLALLLGALCYAAAFAFAGRRAGQGRNFYFYSTAGGCLTVAGVNVVARGSSLPIVLGALGLAAAILGRRLGRMSLRVHAALYLAAGAVETGLFVGCARALASRGSDLLPAAAWVAALAAAAGWAVLATDASAPRSGWGRGPQLLLAIVLVLAVGRALQLGAWTALGAAAGDPALAAAVRTAILGALALGLAVAARRRSWPELGWLVYPVVALGGVKLLVQDLPAGRPATIVLSLALYGAVLVLAPRLLKSEESRGG
jgi:hypothetical protein